MSRSRRQRSRFSLAVAAPEPQPPTLAVVTRAEVGPDVGFAADPRLIELVERALAETSANGAALAMEISERVICCARAGDSAPILGAELNRDSGLSGLCLRTGEPVLCSDAATDDRVDSEAARLLGVASILAVPVRQGSATVGLLEVFSQSPHAFGAAAEEALRRIAEQVVHEPFPNDSNAADVEPAAASEAVSVAEEVALRPEEVATEGPTAEASSDAEQTEPPVLDVPYAPSSAKRRILLVVAALAVVASAAIGLSLGMRSVRPRAPSAPAQTQPEKSPSQMELLQRAAERGEASAQLDLAGRYRDGIGVDRNPAEAVRWLQEAARQGSAEAQFELGNAYADGIGVTRDPINAYACYVIAGANGNPGSEQALKFLTPKLTEKQIGQVRSVLGEMYQEGRGTPVDYVSAYTWFTLANAAGNPDGQRARQSLASKMTKSQIAAAERRATEWLNRHRPQPR